MRQSIYLRLAGIVARERGDTMNQVMWCLALLVTVSVLAVLAARYVSPEWADSVDFPAWLK